MSDSVNEKNLVKVEKLHWDEEPIKVFFQSRLTKPEYIKRFLSILLITALSRLLFESRADESWANQEPFFWIHLATAVWANLFGISIAVRRLRDLGRPGSHYFLFLVPFYNIYLALVLLFVEQQNRDPLIEAIRKLRGASKNCPFCGEKIKEAAVVCRYCNREPKEN